MKFFLAILVISVALTCTAQSKKPDFPWGLANKHATTSRNTGHEIQRKQATDEENEERCSAQLTRLACQAGFFADAVDVYLNCGANSQAEDFARNCDRNEAGEYCGVFSSGSDMVNTARSACLTSSSNSCTTECTNALQSVRDDAGCCINSNFNTSSRNDAIFDYSLWLQCGVETVGNCERTITATPIHNAPVCDDIEVTRRALTAQCSPSNNPILDGVREMEGCDEVVDGITVGCTVNAQGEFCALSFDEERPNPGLNCIMGQQSCPENCRAALDALRADLGCCVNEFLNGTDSQDPTSDFLTSYALWKECGVETPPTSCRRLLGGSLGLMKALPNDSLITKLMFVLTFMVVTVWNM